VNRLEYLLASTILRFVGLLASRRPVDRRRVVLASARGATLDGNLAELYRAMRARRPDLDYVLLLEPYGYGFRAKIAYLVRLVRGMIHVRTAGLVIVDNAYLPIHVAPHRPETTVVQVWHAVSALKRFGADTRRPLREPERTFLHRYYDLVVASAAGAAAPYADAFRTTEDRILPLGTPRTDRFFDPVALEEVRARTLASWPALAGRTVVLYAPTFRGRGRRRQASDALDAAALRDALPPDHVLVLKTHPNLDPALTSRTGFDVVVDPATDINDLLVVTDILVTDYSSSIFEFALLRRPIVLLVPDLVDYERDPGLYLDYRTEMIGTQVGDTAGVAAAIVERRFDLSGYDAFIARHLGACDGRASDRFVDRFLGSGRPGGK
jgi:teichoic acid ribitol-phosphate primase